MVPAKSLVVQTARTVSRYQSEILNAMPTDQSLLGTMYATGYSFSFPLNEVVFSGPALMVTGIQDDTVGFTDAYSLMGVFPRATFAILDRAGHMPEIDQEKPS